MDPVGVLAVLPEIEIHGVYGVVHGGVFAGVGGCPSQGAVVLICSLEDAGGYSGWVDGSHGFINYISIDIMRMYVLKVRISWSDQFVEEEGSFGRFQLVDGLFLGEGYGVQVKVSFLDGLEHGEGLVSCEALFFEPVYNVSSINAGYFMFFV